MIIDLNTIGPDGVRFDVPLSLPPLEGLSHERISVPRAHVTGEVRRRGRAADLRAHLSAEVELTCSRCLETYRTSMVQPFQLTLVPQAIDAPEGEMALTGADEEDVSEFACPDGKADLRDIVTEQIYLGLPLKPMCSESCKGLCPTCGINRNRAACTCAPEETDPRLAPLLRFKQRPTDG